MPVIAVINQSTDTADPDIALWVNAIQQQLLQDVAPFWTEAADANLIFVPQGQAAPPNAWQVVLLDNADRADALGYHELTQASLPIAKVFTATTRNDSQTISRVLSHEIIEMVVNPYIARRQVIAPDTYLVEVGDPVHLDRLGYEKLGVLVSNFVTPAYYRLTTDTRYDMRALLTAPCPTLASGGVLCKLVNGALQLVQAPASTPQEIAQVRINPGSRRDRWQMGQQNWRNSLR
ncbi:MAG: hypothetical protein JO204_18425 [Alphaproteobacteria bacterium]|nr:hypothetical protein [Alphaproteobacteria bacterium]